MSVGFDQEAALARIVERRWERIYEAHLSEHDGRNDQYHWITPMSWQLRALRCFVGTGSGIGGTIVWIDSRGITVEEIRHDRDLVAGRLAR